MVHSATRNTMMVVIVPLSCLAYYKLLYSQPISSLADECMSGVYGHGLETRMYQLHPTGICDSL